jgi:iron complex outermembrane receptor protein
MLMRITGFTAALYCSLIGIGVAGDADAAIRKATHIPAQRLVTALNALAKERDLQVVYRTEVVGALRTQGLNGEFTAEEAFRQLLSGTGLSYRYIDDDTVMILPMGTRPAQPSKSEETAALASPEEGVEQVGVGRNGWLSRLRLAQSESSASNPSAAQGSEEGAAGIETVIVTSEKLPDVYSGGQVARGSRLGLIGNRDIMDTPFSTVNYTNEYIKNIGATRLTDVLTSDPSVTLTSTVARGDDTILIRGFRLLTENMTFDGLYGSAPPRQIAVENVERIELIKGPAALLSGMSPNGDIGGAVNITPKRAGKTPTTQFTAMYAAESEFGGHLDVGRRFGAEEQFGVRFSGVYRDGEGALEGNSRETTDVIVGLDFARGGLRLTGDFGYQKRDYTGIDSDHYLDASVTEVPRAPGANDAHFQPWGWQGIEDRYGSARAEHEFSDKALAYAAVGFARSELRLVGPFAWALQASGDYTEWFWKLAQNLDMNTGELGLRLAVDTGPVEHQLAFAAMKLEREYGQFADFAPFATQPPLTSNIYSPTFVARPPGADFSFPAIPRSTDTTLTSFAVADTLSFAEGRTLLTLGARFQQVEVDRFDGTGARSNAYDEKAVSPAAGLVIKPWKDVSLYANYSQGLSQGPIAPANAVNAGEIFEPSKTKQAEAGVKIDHGAFMTSVALFQVTQPSGLTNPTTLVFSVDGENRHRGIELNTAGELLPGVRVLGGVTFMDPELAKTDGGIADGNVDPGVSKQNVSIGAEWDTPFAPGLTLSTRAIHASSFYLDTANLLESPGYTTVALGARYAFEAREWPVTLRFNVQNVFGEEYWNGPNLYRGGPRAVSLFATVDF